MTSDARRILGGESFLPPFLYYQPYTEIEVCDCVATQLRPTHCLYVVTMAMTDGNELSYSTSDPSGGSTEPPGRPGATAIAMPATAVAMPVLGRPSRRWRWTTQALRRPPTPMSSQCSGLHRRAVGDGGRSRDRDHADPFSGRHRPRTPSR